MISSDVAAWVERLSWNQIPTEVVEDTKLRILDILGVMLGGTPSVLVKNVRRAALQEGSGDDAPVVGFAGRTTLSAAALVNGVLSSILEFDDTHIEAAVHPTGPVAAAAFPMGCKLGISGKQLIEAVLVGNELMCRLGQIAPGMLHKNGFQPTGVLGVFGATYALARILRLPKAAIVNAIGIAGSMSAGPMASFEDGTEVKSLHVGLAASSAVRAIAFAQNGISGPGVLFDGRFGYFRSHVQAQGYDFHFSRLTNGLGEEWEALNVVSKAYPCAYHIHPFLDVAFALKEEHGLRAESILEITCHIADYAVPLVCEPVAEKLRPKTTWHARVSIQHAIAEAIVTGKMDKSAFAESGLQDARINALADRVKYTVDPQADRNSLRADMEVRLRDGSVLRRRVEHMRGTRERPMTRDDFMTKFWSNAQGAVSDSVLEATAQSIVRLENVANVGALLDPLSRQ
jgi:2-methylcitrate dehydratase PrpD